MGGKGVRLDEGEEGQEVAVGVRGHQETAPVVVDNRRIPPAKVGADNVDSVGDEPCEEAIHLQKKRTGLYNHENWYDIPHIFFELPQFFFLFLI